jgi:formylglycine-generating enzyme required for sulfatase activity
VAIPKFSVAFLSALAIGCGSESNGDGDGNGGPGGGQTNILAPSCESATPSCGPNGSESCCASPVVTGGNYHRDYDEVSTNAGPNYERTVNNYRLDKFEITVGRFRKFVAAWAAGWRPAAGSGKHTHLHGGSGLTNSGDAGGNETGWDSIWDAQLASAAASWKTNLSCDPTFQMWTDAPAGNEARPINCINWYEAYAFCIWDGGFLPSEVEWNYAATGGSEQRVYPWSNPPTSTTIDETYASYYVDTTRQCLGDGTNGCAATDLIPVGTKLAGNGRWGQSELAGNVSEWTLDWYAPLYGPTCDNCAHLTPATARAVRGQDFYTGPSALGSSLRDYSDASDRSNVHGARCARKS